MSFVINTTVDKNQELLEAYKELYESDDSSKDVFLISKKLKIAVDSFALVISSNFFRILLEDNHRDTVNILIPDIDPEILKKVVEYIYIGHIKIFNKVPPKDFIEACNLLQLKASITCERKLVFDKFPKKSFVAKATSTPIAKQSMKPSQQSSLDSLIADLEQEEHLDYEMKGENANDNEQVVYEISNYEDAEITYEETDMNEDVSGESYELVNVIPESNDETMPEQKPERKKKAKLELTDIKPRTSPKPVDEETLNVAIREIISNSSSFRLVSEKYQIPKTLLWRRAKKMGYVKGEKQKDAARTEAIEEIKRGESLISLSKKYCIPISTLHREKLKLYEKGQLPENVNLKNRSRGEDYDDRLRVAISEILNGKSQNEVAKRYNIPKTTIWRIIKKMDPKKANVDSSHITPKSEIVEQLLKLSKKRFVKEESLDEDTIKLTKMEVLETLPDNLQEAKLEILDKLPVHMQPALEPGSAGN